MTSIQERVFLDLEGNLSKEFKREIPKDILVRALKQMVQVRIIDERMITLQRQGIITFAMCSIGEEACSIGSAAALNIHDWMYPQYRESPILFWRGFTIQEYVHQMFGNALDLTLGRQMPNHFGSRALNVVTVSSPIGTKIPHAAGCAYAMKLAKEPHVAICYFGEGATSEGDFHVGINFAAVRKAPCIFFCRNNGYAISTPASEQFASDGVAPKGIGYGVYTIKVDGNDFFAVYDATLEAKERATAGLGPTLIEAMTYRIGAHSTSDDPTRYRKEEEVEKWRLKCPVKRLRKYLEKQHLWNDAFEKEWIAEVNKEVDLAIESSKKTKEPSLESLCEHVYFDVPKHLKDQLQEVTQCRK